jgi:hypothetical protein
VSFPTASRLLLSRVEFSWPAYPASVKMNCVAPGASNTRSFTRFSASSRPEAAKARVGKGRRSGMPGRASGTVVAACPRRSPATGCTTEATMPRSKLLQ